MHTFETNQKFPIETHQMDFAPLLQMGVIHMYRPKLRYWPRGSFPKAPNPVIKLCTAKCFIHCGAI